MATLYGESVPDDLHEALRPQARSHRRSISAETISLLEQMVPTERELQRRAAFQSFITADERLVNSLRGRLPILWLGAF